MVAAIILLSLVCIVLLFCLGWSVRLNAKAGGQLLAYEQFYEDTIDDFNEIIGHLEKLMKRELVANDPDVRAVKDSVVVIHDTLIGYVNARQREADDATGRSGAKEKV